MAVDSLQALVSLFKVDSTDSAHIGTCRCQMSEGQVLQISACCFAFVSLWIVAAGNSCYRQGAAAVAAAKLSKKHKLL